MHHPLDRTPTRQKQRIIERANRLRGMLVGSYSQVEYLIGHLWVSMSEIPPYMTKDSAFPYRLESRQKAVRELFEMDNGPLASFRRRALSLLDEMKEHEANRHNFAHGWIRIEPTTVGDFEILVRCFHPTKSNPINEEIFRWSLNRMEAQAKRAADFSSRWHKLHYDIHDSFGWVQP